MPKDEAKEIDAQNDFWFGYNGSFIAPTLPVAIRTREQAYRTAAWIVAMGTVLPPESDDPPTFDEVKDKIFNA